MAYKVLLFLKRGIMKEIGEKLKNSRESIGITIDEAATDLKVKKEILEAIESGDKGPFKDVFYLKDLLKNYSKYLGLDYDQIVEEFNEYLFDFTSKISIDDIKKAEKEQKIKEKNIKEVKISSPYTQEKSQEKKIPTFLIVCGALVLALIVIYIIVAILANRNDEVSNMITSRGVVVNELA